MGPNGVGVEEVRRVHIIYFLCRMGKIEHPHLIRINHLNRNGVRLRCKICMVFSRRYKTSYVWQDLLDDDLIPPILDNEMNTSSKGLKCQQYPLHKEFDICHWFHDKNKHDGLCRQCGKSFKSEKIHIHIKTCKGLNFLAKSNRAFNVVVEKTTSHRSMDASSDEPIMGYLLIR
ncbi:hypothetical protein HHK36_017496 [Tetracentron sinense]|uniref:SOSEKI DIX-like domain-containing protein n=1 Tax=Tetracentron sinense TaxID=13715 RepID=A0A834Z3C9_TETSI|nr:hypothetical protein HHK36_017496 [Tetracentron sinense]